MGGISAVALGVCQRLLGKDRTDTLLTNVCVFLTTIGVLVIVCEFTVRFVFRDISTTADNTSYFARKWRNRHVRMNSFGFREREFDLVKPNGTFRIVVIGDSFTFGQGIAENKRFTNLLGNYLNKYGNYEVLNFGKAGTETIDHLQLLKEFIFKIEPDFVLLQWFVNDFEGNDKKGRPQYSPLAPSPTVHYVLHRLSALYYLTNRKWLSLRARLEPRRTYVTYINERFGNRTSPYSLNAIGTLREFIHECKARGIKVGIALFPALGYDLGIGYPFDYLHKRVVQLCEQEGVKCLDLRIIFSRFPERNRLWVNRFDSHPGPLANKIATDSLVEAFGSFWLSSEFSDFVEL